MDRSASYAARYVAKNIVAAGLAEKCEIQLAYVIGVAEPVSVNVNTYGTGTVEDLEITRLIRKHFDLTPQGIIESLDLRRPIYGPTASYGHFGRDEAGFPGSIATRRRNFGTTLEPGGAIARPLPRMAAPSREPH